MPSSPLAELEILKMIFRCLDDASVRTCSLVCNSWRKAALPCFFHHIAVELSEGDRTISAFIRMLRRNRERRNSKTDLERIRVGDYIQELRLLGDGCIGSQPSVELSPWHLRRIVKRCRNLHTLVLSDLWLAGPGFTRIPSIRPRLDLLKIKECQVYQESGGEYLSYLLSLFPSITTLDLDVSLASLWGDFTAPPPPGSPGELVATVEHAPADPEMAAISFVILRSLPLEWALVLGNDLAQTGKPAESSIQEITVWPGAEVVQGLLPWPQGEQRLVNMGEFIGAPSVGPGIRALRINTMDYPTTGPWLDLDPGTVDLAYLPPRNVRTLQLDQCTGVRSLLFSFGSQLLNPPSANFDLAFQAALDIVEHVSFPQLERVFFHVRNPTNQTESDGQLTHPDWETMDELLAKNTALHFVVIIHAENANGALFQHLLPTLEEKGKVDYWPTNAPWWDLDID